MAKSNFVKKAQKDIFVNGKQVEYVSVKGKREGQTLSKTDKTIPRDDNDTVLIAKGESYYWWNSSAESTEQRKLFIKTLIEKTSSTKNSFYESI